MIRREFIAGLGGAVAWPLTARAQQRATPMRRIGTLWRFRENDPLQQKWSAAFWQALAKLGWAEGRNLTVVSRWDPKTDEEARTFAKELVDLHPDVLITGTPRMVRALQQQTKTVPIVFLGAGDPLATGVVASLSRPEGNTTGVTDIFPSIAGKWLELLKDCVPGLTRVAVVGNPDRLISGLAIIDNYAAIAAQAGAPHRVEVVKLPVRNISEIENAVTAFAGKPDGGLIVLPPPFSNAELETINRLALQHRLPTTYQDPSLLTDGGLLSYGANFLDMIEPLASYVDHVLRGAKPGDLPVQFPSKFRLVVNLKTAKAIGLTIPESFLLRADELIE
jgi:putative tryptophan/tyrosine transport system substrate-binding protein